MAAAPSSHQRTECMSRKDVLAVAKKYGFSLKVAGDGMEFPDIRSSHLGNLRRRDLQTLAKEFAIDGSQKSTVIIEKILFYVAGAAKQAVPAMPLIPVAAVRTVLSSSSDTPSPGLCFNG